MPGVRRDRERYQENSGHEKTRKEKTNMDFLHFSVFLVCLSVAAILPHLMTL
jgi:hypothetical protein